MSEIRGWPLVRLALWTGLASGFGESVVRGLRKVFFGVPLDLEQHLLWMPAAGNAVLFLMLGLLLALPAHRFTAARRLDVIVGLLSGLALLDLLWLFSPALSVYASLLLAAGLGVQIGRWSTRHASGLDRLVARTWAVALVLVPVAAVTITAARSRSESRALASHPPPSAQRPNVLLLVLDTVRRMNLSVYGYYRPTTPALERLAGKGVRFDRAIAAAPWTLSSHASMFTGRWPHELSTDWYSALDDRWPTLAEALSAEGYATGGFVANLSYCNREWGLHRGFAHYEGISWDPSQAIRSSTLGYWFTDLKPIADRLPEYHDGWLRPDAPAINREFLAWLDAVHDRPFFAFLNYFDAHRRYAAGPMFDTAFASIRVDSGTGRRVPMNGDLHAREMLEYDQAIATIDQAIGELLAELDRRGFQNTLVLVTSDHGEEFGEHGMVGHGNSVYYASLAVPLIVALPGWTPEGRVVSEPVSLRDVAATLLAGAGVAPVPVGGQSLSRFWHDSATADTVFAEVNFAPNHAPSVPVSRGDVRSVLAGGYHYIRTGEEERELYHLTGDEWEQVNQLTDPASRDVARALASVVDRLPIRNRPGRPQ